MSSPSACTTSGRSRTRAISRSVPRLRPYGSARRSVRLRPGRAVHPQGDRPEARALVLPRVLTRVRLVALLGLAVVVLAAGCGGGTLGDKALEHDAGSVRSLAAEGALVAQQAAHGEVPS